MRETDKDSGGAAIRVLYLDSSPVERALVEQALLNADVPYRLLALGSLRSVKEALSGFVPDVLVACSELEDGRGVQLLSLVKKAPLVVIVPAGKEEEAAKALKDGATEYLIRDDSHRHLKLLPLMIGSALQQKRQRDYLQMFSHAVMRAGDSIYLTSTDDTIIFVNDAFTESHGYLREEILGTPSKRLFAKFSADTTELLIREPLKDCRGVFALHRRKDGSLLPVFLSRSIIRDEQEQVVAILTVARDLQEIESARTEKLRIERQLVQSEGVELLSRAVGTIAEELEGALRGMAEAISGLDGTHLDSISRRMAQAWNIIERLHAFSADEPLHPTPVRVDYLLPDIISQLQHRFPEQLECEELECPLEEARARIDPAAFSQLIRFLITEAAERCTAAGGKVFLSLDVLSEAQVLVDKIRLGEPGPAIKITVRDTAPTLPAAVVDSLFVPKFSGEEAPGELAAAQLKIRRQGGFLLYRAQEPGNCFEIYLPVSADPSVAAGDAAAGVVVPSPGRKRILFVDDEIPLVKLAALILGRQGFKVTACSTSAEALQRFEQDPRQFDVVVADQTMPKMRGDLLGKIVLGMRPDIPIILCEGYGGKTTQERALQLGFRRMLQKPYRFSDLAAVINELLDDKQPEQLSKPHAGQR